MKVMGVYCRLFGAVPSSVKPQPRAMAELTPSQVVEGEGRDTGVMAGGAAVLS